MSIGDPPPIDSYAAIDLGARRLDIISAIKVWSGASGDGSRMISGSAKRLYKKPIFQVLSEGWCCLGALPPHAQFHRYSGGLRVHHDRIDQAAARPARGSQLSAGTAG